MSTEKSPYIVYDTKHKSQVQHDESMNPVFSTISRKLLTGKSGATEIDAEMLKDHALAVLEAKGYIRRGDKGERICDREKFNNLAFNSDLRIVMGPFANDERLGNKRVIQTLILLFQDVPVYSEEDYKRLQNGEDVKPKNLWYLPKDENAAFDIEAIKQSNSYLGLWNAGISGMNNFKIYGENYPTLENQNTNKLPDHEAVIAAVIYHPQYGDGYRNDKGELIVRYKNGEMRKISSDFFSDWGISGHSSKRDLAISSSPARYVLDFCPELVKRDLLKPEDFARSTALNFPRLPNKRGVVSIDNVLYNLGTDFSPARGNFRVYRLSDSIAGIIAEENGISVIHALFYLDKPSVEDLEQYKANGGKDQIKIVGANEVNYVFKAEDGSEESVLRYFVGLRTKKEQKDVMSAIINVVDYANIVNIITKLSQDDTLPEDERKRAIYWGKRLRGLDKDLPFHNIQTFYGSFETGKVDMEEVAKESVNRDHQLGIIWNYLNKLQPDSTVLDIGCGQGAVAFALAQKSRQEGRKLSFVGYDLARDNVAQAQKFASLEQIQDVKIHEGDWLKSPVRDQEVSMAYCMGRSVHHLVNEVQATSFFMEQNRVIKPGGYLIVDALDPSTGQYRANRLRLIHALEELGKNFSKYGQRAKEEDYIRELPYTVDAPWGNDKDFFNRFTPAVSEWLKLAEQCGFRLESFVREPIFPHDVTRADHGNKESNEMNVTFVFQKKE